MTSQLPLTYRLATIAAAAALAGCSAMNPYQRSTRVDVTISKLGTLAEADGAERLAGNLHGA